ncbi:hypothetical protein SUGI_0673580 [Cryptomeria japonica]|nr:hypothetical protein SUGI_0673580 [Cryptomeria japonica]
MGIRPPDLSLLQSRMQLAEAAFTCSLHTNEYEFGFFRRNSEGDTKVYTSKPGYVDSRNAHRLPREVSQLSKIFVTLCF